MEDIERSEQFMEPHELDALNRPNYEDESGGMVIIAYGAFALGGAFVGSLVTGLIFLWW